jgi:hypothetical protein
MSMSDQSINDRLVVDLAIPLIGTNGLPMNKEGFDTNDNGSLQTMMDIQPMVDEESTEV